jgi:hypothetical protein
MENWGKYSTPSTSNTKNSAHDGWVGGGEGWLLTSGLHLHAINILSNEMKTNQIPWFLHTDHKKKQQTVSKPDNKRPLTETVPQVSRRSIF